LSHWKFYSSGFFILGVARKRVRCDPIMTLIIRNAAPPDIATIQSLAEKTWWPTYSPILEEEQIDYMLKSIYSHGTLYKAMTSGEQTFLVLEDEGNPVGFASYGPWPEFPSFWKIFKLYVLPSTHRKGYGRTMVEEILRRAHAAKIPTIVLNVNRHNPAQNFYTRIGFKVIRKEDIPIGPYWMNDYLLELEIPL
jgi:diamine N-acetyltransferase